MVRKVLSIAVGLVVIFLLGSIASDIIKHIYVNHSDVTYVVLQLVSDCLCCAIGGALTAVVGRSRSASLIVGILFTGLVIIAWLRIKTDYPPWYGITLAVLTIPSVFAGSKVMKKEAT
jgi:peptidoglycan/LPS O-acetylase OafA/YrhL